MIWLLYMAFEPYVRRFWPTLLIGWTRLLSGQVRDPLVGRDILVGAAAGTIAALLTASREFIPAMAGLKLVSPGLPQASILLGTRYEMVAALETLRRAFDSGFDIVCIMAFLKILVRRTWVVDAARRGRDHPDRDERIVSRRAPGDRARHRRSAASR